MQLKADLQAAGKNPAACIGEHTMKRVVILSPGVTLIQDSRFFPLGQDAVLLSRFAQPKKGSLGLDLGAGQGFLSILCGLDRPDLRLEGLELDPDAVAVAEENARRAGLAIPVHQTDLRGLSAQFCSRYDFCLCNPPYYQQGRGKAPQGAGRVLARSDAGASVTQVCQAAFLALKTGGRLYLCFPAGQLAALAVALENSRLALKRLQFVYPREDRPAQLVLTDSVKQGGPGTQVLPPLILRPRRFDKLEESS